MADITTVAMLVAAYVAIAGLTYFAPDRSGVAGVSFLAYVAVAWLAGASLFGGIAALLIGSVVVLPVRYVLRRA